jgi:predicted transcriptional regulator
MADKKTTVIGIRLTDDELAQLDDLSRVYDQSKSRIAQIFFRAGATQYVNRKRKARDELNAVPNLLQVLGLTEASTKGSRKC